MKIFLRLFVCMCLLFTPFLCTLVKAEGGNNPSLPIKKIEDIRRHIVSLKLTEEASCQELWKTLWGLSKKGNLNARAMLAKFTNLNFYGTLRIFMPGRSGDHFTGLRDTALLHLYSEGVEFETGDQQRDFEKRTEQLYKGVLNNNQTLSLPYSACKKLNENTTCAEIISQYTNNSKIKLIPSYEEYVQEIDLMVSVGQKPKCENLLSSPWENKDE